MKAGLVVLVVLVVGIAALGFYRGWFSVAADDTDTTSDVTFSVDRGKMEEDEKAAVANVRGLGRQVRGKGATSAETRTEGALVRVSGDELTMTTGRGKEQTHPLAAGVQVTCDDKACAAADLKAGVRIRVTLMQGAVTRLEALDRERDFHEAR